MKEKNLSAGRNIRAQSISEIKDLASVICVIRLQGCRNGQVSLEGVKVRAISSSFAIDDDIAAKRHRRVAETLLRIKRGFSRKDK